MGGDFSLKSYGVTTIILALVIVILTVLLFTTLLTMVSTYAKSIKEASSLSMPLMIVVMLISMSNFMATTASVNPVTRFFYLSTYSKDRCLIIILTPTVLTFTSIVKSGVRILNYPILYFLCFHYLILLGFIAIDVNIVCSLKA
jgi:sodium transport system permease protein